MPVLNYVTYLAATEESGGIDALGVNPIAILIQAGTFVLLYFIVKKFALTPIVQKMDERRKKIEESLVTADKIEQRDQATAEEADKILKAAHKKADGIIAKSHEEAGSIVKDAEDSAVKKADQIIVDAHSRIEQDVKSAKNQLKKDVLGYVAQATEVVLDEKIDDKKDAELLERAVQKEMS